jgi:hypothetical protein
MKRFLIGLLLALAFALPAVADQKPKAFVVYASATINADTYTATQIARGYNGGILTVDVTELGTDQTVTIRLQYYSPAQATWVTLFSTSAVSSTGTQYISIANPALSIVGTQYDWTYYLPREWRLMFDVENANNCKLSAGFSPWVH